MKNKKAAHDHGIAIGPTCVLSCAKGIAIFKDEKGKEKRINSVAQQVRALVF